MDFQKIWKKSKRILAFVLAVSLFFGGWGNYDFSVVAVENSQTENLIVELEASSNTYTGNAITLPKITKVTKNGTELTEYNVNWSVAGTTVTEPGTYTVTVEEKDGENPLTGTAEFKVELLDLSKCTIQLETDSFEYDGNAKKPDVSSVKLDGQEINTSVYQVSYSGNVNAGTGTVTVQAKEGYTEKVKNNVSKTFKITAKTISKGMFAYNSVESLTLGKTYVPNISLKKDYQGEFNFDTTIKKDGKDVTKITETGTYEVCVKAREDQNYTGEVELFSFKVKYGALGDSEKVTIEGNTLADNIYQSVEIKAPAEYVIAKSLNEVGTTKNKSIRYDQEGEYKESSVYLKDSNGEIVETKVSFTIDSTAPVVTLDNENSILGEENSWKQSNKIVVQVTEKNLFGVYYGTEKPSNSGISVDELKNRGRLEENKGNYSVTFGDIKGITTYYVYAVDKAGNVSNLVEVSIGNIDNTAPEIDVDKDMPCYDSDSKDECYWINGDITDNNPLEIKLTKLQDATSGINNVKVEKQEEEKNNFVTQKFFGNLDEIKDETIKVTEPGTYIITVTDGAGKETTVNIIVKEDTKAPNIGTIKVKDTAKELNNSVTYWSQSEEIAFEVNLEGEGTDQAPIYVKYGTDVENLTTLTLMDLQVKIQIDTANEAKKYYVQVWDKAGNCSETKEISVGHDAEDPTIGEIGLKAKPESEQQGSKQWINKDIANEYKGYDKNSGVKICFSVTAKDNVTATNALTIKYKVDEEEDYKDVKPEGVGKSSDYYVTAGYYADGKHTLWVEVTDASGRSKETNLEVNIDTKAPSEEVYIQFLSDVEGGNATFTKIEGQETNEAVLQWQSGVVKFQSALEKIWGKNKVSFLVYVTDVETEVDKEHQESGISSLTMTYGESTFDLTTDVNEIRGVQALLSTDQLNSENQQKTPDLDKYTVYKGSIEIGKNSFSEGNLKITEIQDKAGNKTEDVVVLKTEDKESVIYLDNVAPKLVSVTTSTDPTVVKEKNDNNRHLYSDKTTLKVVIDEAFFLMDSGNAPQWTLSKNNVVCDKNTDGSEKHKWEKDEKTGTWYLELELAGTEEEEVEYQLELSYTDSSGNALVMGDGVPGKIEGNTYTSVTYVIDQKAPELTEFTVNKPTEYTFGEGKAAIYANNDDLQISFTIDDNEADYAVVDDDQTVLELYRVGKDEPITLKFLRREHKNGTRTYQYFFNYAGEKKTEDEFYVKLSYKDAVGNQLTKAATFLGTLNDGVYTSEHYIIDHVAPVFDAYITTEDTQEQDTNIFKERRYFNDSRKLVLSVTEKYFKATNNKPTYQVKRTRYEKDGKVTIEYLSSESKWVEEETSIETSDGDWGENGNKYSLKVSLDAVEDQEVEYQVSLSYEDAAGNQLSGEGVAEGTYTSQTFVIDQLAPELEEFTVKEGTCELKEATVLKNPDSSQTSSGDLNVTFTINENPDYFKDTSISENLQAEVYRKAETVNETDTLVKTYTLQTFKDSEFKDSGFVTSDGNNSGELIKGSTNGRSLKFSFTYSPEDTPDNLTENEFYVKLSYVDEVENQLTKAATNEREEEIPGTLNDGVYTSEDYIIDHVAPVFTIYSYSDATNVVKNDSVSDTSKAPTVSKGKTPENGYKSYYNTDIAVTMTVEEKYAHLGDSNSLKHFVLKISKDGEEPTNLDALTWTEKEDGTLTASVVIQALEDHGNDGEYQISVAYQDCAGNVAKNAESNNGHNEKDKSDDSIIYKSPILVMDTTSPEITKIDYNTIDNFHTVKGTDFVNADTTITFSMTETNPRPDYIYQVTNEDGKKDTKVNYTSLNVFSTDAIEMYKNGDLQTISISVEDWAGNKAIISDKKCLRSESNTKFSDGTFTDQFIVDTKQPEIEMEYLTWPNTQVKDESGTYIDYFTQGVTVLVTVTEHNFDKDNFTQSVTRTDANIPYTETEWTKDGDVYTKQFIYSKDNQYDLSIKGTDNAGNVLKWKTEPNAISATLDDEDSEVTLSTAVDSTIPAIGDNVKPVIVIKPSTSQGETTDGQALYHSDVTYEVVVYDPKVNDYASGIDCVTFDITGEDGTASKCTVNKQGVITCGDGVNIQRVTGDIGKLAKGEENKYTFYVTISSEVFNTNGIVMKVYARDVATTENKKITDPIAIDITKPKVVISYDNNDVSNEKYFHDVRVATITVTERNFSNECLQFLVNGSDKNLQFALVNAGTGNRDDAVWVAHYTFTADSDYKVNTTIRDRAQNIGTVEYVGEAPQEFTIDMIKPIITVEYDNNSFLNEYYYKEARIATVTIEEHNFSVDDVNITLTAKDNGSAIGNPTVSGWSTEGDLHRAVIRYDYDGEFTFDIEFMDLATNEADDYDMDHFVVDLTAPELEIFDIENMSANNGVVRPGIRYYDTNYDADGTEIIMTGYHNGVVVMDGEKNVQANGLELKLNDFAYEQEMDDLYTMNAVVYDLAGNSSEATTMFSVNRYGSVYTFDEKTDELIGDNGKYYTNQEQELVITETNVDTLEFKEITCNLNGKLMTLEEDVDYTVSMDGNDSTWKQYTYRIHKENFEEEGTYILTIYSEDRATNNSDNNSKGKKVEFVVDKTNPSVLISGVTNGGQYRTNSKEITIDVEDNIRLAKVVVLINGEEKVYDADLINAADGKLVLNIPDELQWQDIQVIVYDAAGNVQYSDEIRVLVTANIIVQWYRNTPVFYGSLATVTVLAASAWWFLVAKKKNRMK